MKPLLRVEFVTNYTAVILAVLLSVLFVLVAFLIAYIISPRQFTKAKASIYECGMVPFPGGWFHIHVRYYIFAILFMIFDVETVFLYPWAVMFVDLGMFGFLEMMLFIAILLFGLGYAWKKGALQWK